jgi:hypothetical protein
VDDDVPGVPHENEVTRPMQAAAPAPTDPAPALPAQTSAPGWRAMAVPVAAALIVGLGAGYALNDVTSSNGGSPGGQRGFPTALQGNGPGGFSQGAPPQGGFGGVQGEERIQGTVAATTGSTITVRSSTGTTATYTVDSTSQIVSNGQSGTLADVKVGDTVFVHVVPGSSGNKVVERLFVGTLPQGGPGGAPPGSDGQSGSTQSQAF